MRDTGDSHGSQCVIIDRYRKRWKTNTGSHTEIIH